MNKLVKINKAIFTDNFKNYKPSKKLSLKY